MRLTIRSIPASTSLGASSPIAERKLVIMFTASLVIEPILELIPCINPNIIFTPA